VRNIAHYAVPVALSFDDIRKASITDSHTKRIATAIKTEVWPVELHKFELIKSELCVYDDVILRGHRIYIPGNMRPSIIKLAHEGHQGIVKTKQRLRTKGLVAYNGQRCGELLQELPQLPDSITI